MSASEVVAPERADKHYDVVVIGSGAGGATLAQRLASTGKSILMLERGEHLPVEPDNWIAEGGFYPPSLQHQGDVARPQWAPVPPNIHYWVGGNTIFYGAALYRSARATSKKPSHHGGKISPAWPIRYEDLADYYTEAEALWNVHGKRGCDPTDDADAPPYTHPPMTHDPEIKALKGRLTLQGFRPFAMPIATERDDTNIPESTCVRCRTCGGFPCLRQAKSDGRKMVSRALKSKTVELITGAQGAAPGDRARCGKSVSAVVYETPDGEKRVSGDIVVLAAGAINSAAFYCVRRTRDHPNGLANGSDQVGRNYMFHTRRRRFIRLAEDRHDLPEDHGDQ